MAKYAIFFSYSAESWAQMIKNPGDRPAAVRKLIENQGGKLESFYFMFGERDGFAVFDMPDAKAAAALSIAVASTGALDSMETHELIAPQDMPGILQQSSSALGSYAVPGS